jgi:hypothetical protein
MDSLILLSSSSNHGIYFSRAKKYLFFRDSNGYDYELTKNIFFNGCQLANVNNGLISLVGDCTNVVSNSNKLNLRYVFLSQTEMDSTVALSGDLGIMSDNTAKRGNLYVYSEKKWNLLINIGQLDVIKGPPGPKGEPGAPLAINYIVASTVAMNLLSPSTGEFALVIAASSFSSGALYVYNGSSWQFIVNLSSNVPIRGPPGRDGVSVISVTSKDSSLLFTMSDGDDYLVSVNNLKVTGGSGGGGSGLTADSIDSIVFHTSDASVEFYLTSGYSKRTDTLQGPRGLQGLGIKNINMNRTGDSLLYEITLDNNTVNRFSTPVLRGLQGPQGIPGTVAAMGATGPKGETIISAAIASDILMFTTSDSNVIVAGNVRGRKGEMGGSLKNIQSVGDNLVFTDQGDNQYTVPAVVGPRGLPGPTGPIGPQGEMINNILNSGGSVNVITSTGRTIPIGGIKGEPGHYIVSATIDASGNLILNRSDSNQIIVGKVLGDTGAIGQKGETGKDFKINYIFSNTSVLLGTIGQKGDIALINSSVEDDDNARLYIYNGSSWEFMTDLSGAQGLKGPSGEKGQKGELGTTGDTGVKGEPGTDFRIKYIFASIASMTAGSLGDFAIIDSGTGGTGADDGKLYFYNGSSWVYLSNLTSGVNIVGPKGEVGVQGTSGSNFEFTYTPSSALALSSITGNNGEFALIVSSDADNGKLYEWRSGTWILISNIIGPQGVAGTAGGNGAQGIQGPIGPVGPTGGQGIRGIQGLIGPTGLRGPTGPQGYRGPAGPGGVGSLGPVGPTGPQGGQGIIGPRGGTGPRGIQGVPGPTGLQGPTGPQGIRGPFGIGPTGAGIDGPTGPMGPTGPRGPRGFQGPTGAGVQGVQGPTGPQGVRGPTGPQGVQGLRGPVGPTGPAGSGGGGGSTVWKNGPDSSIFYQSGSVGVKTKVPLVELHVTGSIIGNKVISDMYLESSDSTSFDVTVTTKTIAHRYFGSGSTLGYVIETKESPFITFVPGKTYRFKQDHSSNNTHQIRFYEDAAKTTLYSTNVTYNGTAGTAGSYTQIVITDTTPGILYYQCTNHPYMGNQIQVLGIGTSTIALNDLTDITKSDTNTLTLSLDANRSLTLNSDVVIDQSLTNTDSVTFRKMVLDSTITVGKITIPNTDGTNGQVLKTDGNGNLSWQADLVGAQSLPQLSDVTKSDTNTLTLSLDANRSLTLNSDVTLNQSLTKTDSVSFKKIVLDSTITVGKITIPNTDGINGQVLKTDGNGNLSWQADLAGAQSLPQLSDVSKADANTLTLSLDTNRSLTLNSDVIIDQSLTNKDSVTFRKMVLDSTITVGKITIPNTDGTNGQVLKTDGSGNLSWQADLVGAQSLPELSDVTKADANNLTLSLDTNRSLTLNANVTVDQSVSTKDSVTFRKMNVDSTITVGKITIPNTDGTNGQVLKTDGSGNLSWQDAGFDFYTSPLFSVPPAPTFITNQANSVEEEDSYLLLKFNNFTRYPLSFDTKLIPYIEKFRVEISTAGTNSYNTLIDVTLNNDYQNDTRPCYVRLYATGTVTNRFNTVDSTVYITNTANFNYATNYDIRIAYSNKINDTLNYLVYSSASLATPGATAPSAPRNLVFSNYGATSFDITYAAPTSTGGVGSTISDYKIEVTPSGTIGSATVDTSSPAPIYNGTNLTRSITGLVIGNRYTISVTARNNTISTYGAALTGTSAYLTNVSAPTYLASSSFTSFKNLASIRKMTQARTLNNTLVTDPILNNATFKTNDSIVFDSVTFGINKVISHGNTNALTLKFKLLATVVGSTSEQIDSCVLTFKGFGSTSVATSNTYLNTDINWEEDVYTAATQTGKYKDANVSFRINNIQTLVSSLGISELNKLETFLEYTYFDTDGTTVNSTGSTTKVPFYIDDFTKNPSVTSGDFSDAQITDYDSILGLPSLVSGTTIPFTFVFNNPAGFFIPDNGDQIRYVLRDESSNDLSTSIVDVSNFNAAVTPFYWDDTSTKHNTNGLILQPFKDSVLIKDFSVTVPNNIYSEDIDVNVTLYNINGNSTTAITNTDKYRIDTKSLALISTLNSDSYVSTGCKGKLVLSGNNSQYPVDEASNGNNFGVSRPYGDDVNHTETMDTYQAQLINGKFEAYHVATLGYKNYSTGYFNDFGQITYPNYSVFAYTNEFFYYITFKVSSTSTAIGSKVKLEFEGVENAVALTSTDVKVYCKYIGIESNFNDASKLQVSPWWDTSIKIATSMFQRNDYPGGSTGGTDGAGVLDQGKTSTFNERFILMPSDTNINTTYDFFVRIRIVNGSNFKFSNIKLSNYT